MRVKIANTWYDSEPVKLDVKGAAKPKIQDS